WHGICLTTHGRSRTGLSDGAASPGDQTGSPLRCAEYSRQFNHKFPRDVTVRVEIRVKDGNLYSSRYAGCQQRAQDNAYLRVGHAIRLWRIDGRHDRIVECIHIKVNPEAV